MLGVRLIMGVFSYKCGIIFFTTGRHRLKDVNPKKEKTKWTKIK